VNDNLKTLLEQTSESDLRLLVENLYGKTELVDNIIETALLASDIPSLAKHLKKQVQSLNRGRRFISYGESFEFSRSLDSLVQQISALLPKDPKAAFELADLFMSTHSKVYERCDDSGGNVGESYREALELWLQAASAWKSSDQPCKLDWISELRKRYDNNDYAVWDYLISGSAELLGEDLLQELGRQFEAELNHFSKIDSGGYNRDRSHAKLGMKSVAEALGDVPMYERSYLIGTPQPNELQKEDLAKFCLKHKNPEAALKWLEGEWQPRSTYQHQQLLDAAYLMMGRNDDLLRLRQEVYYAQPSYEHLHALLEIVSDAEREDIQIDAVARASSSDNLPLAVRTLMKLDDMDAAAKYVLHNIDKLSTAGYYELADWADEFENQGWPLVAVAMYRVLLLDILERARAKAYRYASEYYNALERLDSRITDYAPVIEKSEFDTRLRQQHNRKHKFWSMVS